MASDHIAMPVQYGCFSFPGQCHNNTSSYSSYHQVIQPITVNVHVYAIYLTILDEQFSDEKL